jgi:hypothetical protein
MGGVLGVGMGLIMGSFEAMQPPPMAPVNGKLNFHSLPLLFFTLTNNYNMKQSQENHHQI